MSIADRLNDAGTQLFSGTVTSLSRRIDNELNSDFLPSPLSSTRETPVVRTSESNPRGVAKTAGTGPSLLPAINTNTALLAGSALALGVVAYLALR